MYLRYTSKFTPKYLVKTMNQNRAGFMLLKNKFSQTRDAEIKEEEFVGTNIRQLIKYVKYIDQQIEVEKENGNHSKISLSIFGEILRQNTTVIWLLNLQIITKLWSVICVICV